ncbi:HpcH/HpaI aldolase/citrate lyase family protein [Xanthobacter tagetidis]|jgi:citrate lyase subunit beta/citryl-CoA lyase|uniref:CoA ester lyase n=1 Tax=Xanthobacter tagetidis TaxID=60216 RepID=A0A3L7A8N1_9HYPH|nr:CoA ester lyase [Xanthobacter tagetidis]MBB6306515.1 citrate lyase subunit beta/citryl-CoA lyase [Xanthobacter tagetidis]RLP76180.1 CoA ester lyase [Xanthobacter tagetidis]
MSIRPRRSVLYMPGSNARALEKARTLPADGVILDLEDAVAPDAKVEARARVVETVKAGGFGPREVAIRINGLDTAWGSDDLDAAAAAAPDAILVPKVQEVEQLVTVGRRLKALGVPETTRVWAMIETPLAILDIKAIALSARDPLTRLQVFVLGTNDLAKETRAALVPGRAPMVAWLSLVVAAARTSGIDVLDGVWNQFQDLDGFKAECAQGAQFGMDGKTLIHPSQIEPCNAAFSPPAAEVERARAIIAAFALPENAGKGVITLDGRMVELLHAEMAKRTVALADAITAKG